MVRQFNSEAQRKKRRKRVRGKISGTPARPRLNVYRSLNHIYAQVVDDTVGKTLASASTLDKEAGPLDGKPKKEQARAIGKLVAKRAVAAGITKVVFDRAGYLYHGRVMELAEGAREGGLEF